MTRGHYLWQGQEVEIPRSHAGVTPLGRDVYWVEEDQGPTLAVALEGEEGLWVALRGRTYFLAKATANPSRTRKGREVAASGVAAPMPGKIVRIAVSLGAQVKEGELLVVLEAMKMEHPLHAPVRGEVRAIYVQAGEVVEMGRELMEIGD